MVLTWSKPAVVFRNWSPAGFCRYHVGRDRFRAGIYTECNYTVCVCVCTPLKTRYPLHPLATLDKQTLLTERDQLNRALDQAQTRIFSLISETEHSFVFTLIFSENMLSVDIHYERVFFT